MLLSRLLDVSNFIGSSSFRPASENGNETYEMKVKQFLEETKKGETKKADYYEEQVRRFLEETAKW